MKTQHALLGLGLLLTLSCNTHEVAQVSNSSDAPIALHDWTHLIPENQSRVEKFTVSTSKESFITTSRGSKLSIPASCFVDENGSIVEGNVEIAWEEFHTLGDQIFSNINMMYDSAGVSLPLISGGMFRIDGACQNKAVFIAKDKTIKVDILSQNPQENFNFYQQDANSTQWTYKMNTNANFDNSIGIPSTLSPKSTSDLASSGRSGAIIDAKPKNIKDFPELNPEEILGWLTPKDVSTRELYNIKSDKWVCTLEPLSNNNYHLNFQLEDEKFSYPVQIFTYKDAEEETAEQKALLEQEKKEANERRERMEKQELVRTAEISKFATYNWDVCGRMAKPADFYTNFVTDDQSNLDELNFALVCLSNQYQVKFDIKRDGRLQFDASCRNTIIALDDTGKIYFVEPESLADFGKKEMTQNDALALVDSGILLNSSKDLDKLINDLRRI